MIDDPEDEAFNDIERQAKQRKEAVRATTQTWRESASDYERGFIDGMQKQMQSSVDKAVNRMAQTQEPKIGCVNHDCDKCKAQTQEPVAWFRYQQGSRVYYDSKKWDDCQPLYTSPPQHTERPVDCERCNRLEEHAYDLVAKLRVANIKLSMQSKACVYCGQLVAKENK